MKVIRLGPDEVFYRFLTPKWSHLPSSGAGAAQNGGRFNRPGVEAVYLAREVETATPNTAWIPRSFRRARSSLTASASTRSSTSRPDMIRSEDGLPSSRNGLASGRQSPGLTARCRQLGASPTISSSQVGAGCCSPQPVRAVAPTSSCSRPTSRRRTGLSRMTLRRVFRMIRVRGRNARTGQVPRPRAGVLKGPPSPSLIPLTSGARSASDGRLRGREPRSEPNSCAGRRHGRTAGRSGRRERES